MSDVIKLRTRAEIDEEAAVWAWRMDAGSVSAADQQAHEVWLRQDPRHARAFRELSSVWRTMDGLAEAKREAARDVALGELVSVEQRQQSASRVQEDTAALAQAQATLNTARLNLTRTRVVAQVDGIVTNLELEPGDYLTEGRQALALVDTDSLRIEGYFEETKLPRIHIGDPVSVHIMGEPGTMPGHVVSIAGAIADRERTPTQDLVANISPTFSWVRLAQRIPVRVLLDNPPPDVRLICKIFLPSARSIFSWSFASSRRCINPCASLNATPAPQSCLYGYSHPF